jgi:hypothetical protein
MKHPLASTTLSRPVDGAVDRGGLSSPGASRDAGLTSSTHSLGDGDMTPA